MEVDEDDYQFSILKQASWIPKLVDFQINLIANPIISLVSLFTSLPFHRPPIAPPRRAATSIIKRVGYGLVGATYVGVALTAAMVVAAVVGVVLVSIWVEEPVYVREKLFLDYTEPNPVAVAWFSKEKRRKIMGFPVGHTVCVEVRLLLPDSDFNREVGNFQLAADALSSKGDTVARCSQPCISPFRSYPIRLIMAAAPVLLLGIAQETQRVTANALRYKEVRHARTEAIRITLVPRAGTNRVPQLYEAEIVVRTHLPWIKEVMRKWKLTLSVWTSVCVYIVLVVVVLHRYAKVMFPVTVGAVIGGREGEEEITPKQVLKEMQVDEGEGAELSHELRRRQQQRKKRRAVLHSTM